MHDILFSLATSLSLSRSFFRSMVSLVGLGLARFSFKKTEIEIFFNSCKVKNSSIWWCVGGGGGIGDIRPPFCWGLHKIKGVCVCLFFFHFRFILLSETLCSRGFHLSVWVCWFVRLAVFVWWYSFVYLRILNISFEWIVFFVVWGKLFVFFRFIFSLDKEIKTILLYYV